MQIRAGETQEEETNGEIKGFLDCVDNKETGKLDFIISYLPHEEEGRIEDKYDTDDLDLNLPKVEPDSRKPERTGWKRYIGMLMALCSCMTFTLCILIVKYMSHKISPASFGVYRFIGVLLSLPVLLYYQFIKKVNVCQTIWPLTLENTGNIKTLVALLLRGFSGCTAILLQYSALQYISMAATTTITFSTPIFVGLFAWIFLREKCGIIHTLAAFITLAGVIVTANIVPGASGEVSVGNEHLIGGALAFVSMLFGTSVFVVLRYLRRVHVTLVTTAFGTVGLIESAVVCAVFGRFDLPDSAWEWFLVANVGILTLFSQTLMTCALKFEDAGPISLMRTTDIVFAFVWQFLFLGVNPDVSSSVGALIVCLGVGLIGFRKYLTTLPSEHPRRRIWAFMLK